MPYYVCRDGNSIGSYSKDWVWKYYKEGVLKPGDWIRLDCAAEWMLLSEWVAWNHSSFSEHFPPPLNAAKSKAMEAKVSGSGWSWLQRNTAKFKVKEAIVGIAIASSVILLIISTGQTSNTGDYLEGQDSSEKSSDKLESRYEEESLYEERRNRAAFLRNSQTSSSLDEDIFQYMDGLWKKLGASTSGGYDPDKHDDMVLAAAAQKFNISQEEAETTYLRVDKSRVDARMRSITQSSIREHINNPSARAEARQFLREIEKRNPTEKQIDVFLRNEAIFRELEKK